jgi:Mg-chelatase subunit ChlD|tara:strand:- start:1471 stop:1581 length:111 start_codon:yes stop_codon:yes gene_type:complete
MREDKSRNPAIMLFTDGVPNRSPKEGEVAALKNLLA